MCQVSDRFFAAIHSLTGDGTVKQRLVVAYLDHLEAIRTDDLPESIRPRFELLRKAMSAVPPTEKETVVQVSVRKMSQTDAMRFTGSIVAMFAELVRVKTTGERLNAGESPQPSGFSRPASEHRVPTFLAHP